LSVPDLYQLLWCKEVRRPVAAAEEEEKDSQRRVGLPLISCLKIQIAFARAYWEGSPKLVLRIVDFGFGKKDGVDTPIPRVQKNYSRAGEHSASHCPRQSINTYA